MVPSPQSTDRKRGFERIYLFASFLGCCFLLLLVHSYGRSPDPGFENELHKRENELIKVGPLSAIMQLGSSHNNYKSPSRPSQFSKVLQA